MANSRRHSPLHACSSPVADGVDLSPPNLNLYSIRAVSAPSAPIYRVARIGADPFEPSAWEFTGGNRFDDLRPMGYRTGIRPSPTFVGSNTGDVGFL